MGEGGWAKMATRREEWKERRYERAMRARQEEREGGAAEGQGA
eukprot:SAG11_NODE_43588_length_164_cov_11.015385_1_plen_42_part_10